MKKIIPLILILSLLLAACAGESTQEKSIYPEYDVVRVVDGDTLVINYEGTDEKVRLIGVDTPESVHPDKEKNTAFGDEVSEYATSQLSGKSVGIEFDVSERDQYGRLLAYVYLGDKMFNKTLLELGYASVATFPPNVKYVDEFTEVQKTARENGVGMWADGFSDSAPADNSSNSASDTQTNSPGTYNGHSKNKKFHLPGCRYGDMIVSENLITFESRDAALNEGYAPCKVCNP